MKPFAFALAMLGCSTAVPAIAAGDPHAGRALAEMWCTYCHTVTEKDAGRVAAPPFSAVVERNRKDQAWVRAWLANPHPPMQYFNLSGAQIDDIVAYLDSLTGH